MLTLPGSTRRATGGSRPSPGLTESTTIALAGRIMPGSLTPHMRGELTGLYRRWQADQACG
ncbi:MAG: hypothetical protein ACRDRJ_48715 [Streptosporangiaceae bacterium]